jgi:hypothetical protein
VPDAQPSTIDGAFRQPFNAQVAFFRQKLGNLVPTQWWDDMLKAEHDHGFMVAGAEKADLLADLAAAVERGIAEGTSIEQFRKDFRAIVARHGWTGWTGEGTPAGQAWRTRTIYVTNARTSYHAGRLAQLRAGKFPLWVYRHNDAVQHPRPLHVSWNGITLPPSHIFWQTHYTPNGWGCECYILGARSPAAARRLGGDPDKPLPEGWDAIDPKTGEPPGVDKGWGYMPGATVADAVQEMATKTVQWPYTLAKAYMQDVPADARDALATAYRSLPSVADDVRRYAQRALAEPTAQAVPPTTLGLLTDAQADLATHATGVDVRGFDWALDTSAVQHVASGHGTDDTETPRGQEAVTAQDYALLPQLLNAVDSITRSGTVQGRPVVRVEGEVDGRRVGASFELRKGRRMLALLSFWLGKTKP